MNYSEKVEIIKNNIIANAQVYKDILAGHYYLYIFDNRCFEMYFATYNFMHLTGVDTNLPPKQFYALAKNGRLRRNQLFFNSRHPLKIALKKTEHLKELPQFVSEGYFIIKDFVTDTTTYPYVITNIDQSLMLGLKSEEVLEEIYIPKSFRVKGNIFDKTINENIFEIEHILSKTDKDGLYDKILYSDNSEWNKIDDSILKKINPIVYS